MARDGMLVSAGVAAGICIGVGGVAAWNAAVDSVDVQESAPSGYRVSCVPEGVKTSVMCRVTKYGKFQKVDSGWYLEAEDHYPEWKEALGTVCADSYREYRDYVDATWEKIEADQRSAVVARSDDRFYFDCFTRGES